MAPDDPSPHGGEILHELPEPRYPEPKPGEESDEPVRGQPRADQPAGQTQMSQRPSLPEHPVQMPADIEEGQTDPPAGGGPGSSDGLTSLRKQRG